MGSNKSRALKLPPLGARTQTAHFLADLLADIRAGEISRALDQIDRHREIVDQHEFASYLAGLVRVTKGDDLAACDHFDRAIALNPDHALALYGRAIALQKSGRVEASLRDLERLLQLDPDNAEVWHNYGAAKQLTHCFDEALTAYSKALDVAPNSAAILANRALTLHALGRDGEAILDYDQALSHAPGDKTLWYNRAVSQMRMGDIEAALSSFEEAFRLDQSYAAAADGAMSALFKLRRFDKAIALCDAVLAAEPNRLAALFTKGNALHELKRYADALSSFDQAMALAPTDAKVLSNRGMTLFELGRLEEAHASAMAAIAHERNFALAWRCRGMVELRLALLDNALCSFDTALTLAADRDPDALCGRAIVLKELSRFEEAIADFDRALAIDPNHFEAKANKGTLLLLLGRFDQGLELFEHRWIYNDTPKTEATYEWPEWRGEDISGKKLIVFDEAGLGDALQYYRYLPLLVEAGAHVAFLCRPSLRRLFVDVDPRIELLEGAKTTASYDFCITLCSLPRIFGTRLTNIPAWTYLRAEADRVALWAKRLGKEGFKVGLSWHGSSHPKSDLARNVPLAALAPLAAVKGVRLISLQKNFGAEQIDLAPEGMRIETLGDDFDTGPDAFIDTAAIIESLDLVVTIDTSIAHLAGALGKPVWIAIKNVPEWRWLLERNDSPWYPTAKLFRQTSRGHWNDVFERMAQALEVVLRESAIGCASPILIPGSVGDLIDRLTILEIKSEKISDDAKLANVAYELDLLRDLMKSKGFSGTQLDELAIALKTTNLALWGIEDRIRHCEAREDFGQEFIELARSVYKENDRRANLKRQINTLCGSRIVEEKSYDDARRKYL
jgi:tetratricopeptide (TPR) repeat protein